MPLYEFVCNECGETLEIFKKWSNADSEELCPKCGAVMVKAVSASNFKLSGSGWAKDGYR